MAVDPRKELRLQTFAEADGPFRKVRGLQGTTAYRENIPEPNTNGGSGGDGKANTSNASVPLPILTRDMGGPCGSSSVGSI